MSRFSASLLTLYLVASAFTARASPLHKNSKVFGPVVPVPLAEIASYKPYTYFASAAYFGQDFALNRWSCGEDCEANPDFVVTSAGGDNKKVQWWYVGYSPSLKTIIVAHEGTDDDNLHADWTDLNLRRKKLHKNDLFPTVPKDVSVHIGFQKAHAKTAAVRLVAVKTALALYPGSNITFVGHSLGAAVAVLDAAYIPLHIPGGVPVRAVTFGLPHMGNAAWADYVDASFPLTHINNKMDCIPTMPAAGVGFVQPDGEIHIVADGTWMRCPGHDNTDPRCTAGSVNLRNCVLKDHTGPYDGVMI